MGTQVHESDVIPGLGLRASREASLAEVVMCDMTRPVRALSFRREAAHASTSRVVLCMNFGVATTG